MSALLVAAPFLIGGFFALLIASPIIAESIQMERDRRARGAEEAARESVLRKVALWPAASSEEGGGP